MRTWFASNREITAKPRPVQGALLDEIDAVRYASSLRASVNRYGSWHNFDFWHGLGFGARREAFARATNQMIELRGFIKTALNDSDVADAHGFLAHFQTQVEEATSGFFLDVQQFGESAFADQLREDHAYWEQCQQRWGMSAALGTPYKHDIRRWTKDWFTAEFRQARHEFIEKEIQRMWQELTERLAQQLETADGKQLPMPA